MPDQSSQSIEIAAPPAAVMAVVADFGNYPVWAQAVKRAEVLEAGPDGRARRVAFSLDAGVFRDEFELSYTWSGDESVHWTLVSGRLMRSQDGSYALRPLPGGGTDVTYTLSVELAIPILGMLKRKGERIVMEQALDELKKHVETMAR